MLWAIQYQVVGRVPFPVDMLRYDRCFPLGTNDAHVIMASIQRDQEALDNGFYRVRLIHMADNKHWLPVKDRWQSFMWGVVESSIEATRATS